MPIQSPRRILMVVGTRPEAVKMAPVYQALSQSATLKPEWLSTGQHREMLRQTMDVFGIRPDYDLQLMTAGQSLTSFLALALSHVAAHLTSHPVDAVLVQGDTTTVLAAAQAAFHHRVPVGHVEAGLRTGDMRSPWPEEMNRRLTSPLCRWHFAPTRQSQDNLLAEGIPAEWIHLTGNTVIDALSWVSEKLRRLQPLAGDIAARLGIRPDFANQYLADPASRWLLVTGHRRESFGPGFQQICEGLRLLVERYPDVGILYPVHLNPNVQEPVNRLIGDHPRIALAQPASYEDFVWLMKHCHFILSDSGGVQEEAPSLGKPVLVLREITERPEGLVAGTCRVVGTDPQRMLAEASILLDDSEAYRRRCEIKNPYGDGLAAERIVRVLESADFSSSAASHSHFPRPSGQK